MRFVWEYTGNASSGGAADRGLENRVGFHSTVGGIKNLSTWRGERVIKQDGMMGVGGHIRDGNKSASSVPGQGSRGQWRGWGCLFPVASVSHGVPPRFFPGPAAFPSVLRIPSEQSTNVLSPSGICGP